MAKKKNERIDESLFNEEISTTVEKNNFNDKKTLDDLETTEITTEELKAIELEKAKLQKEADNSENDKKKKIFQLKWFKSKNEQDLNETITLSKEEIEATSSSRDAIRYNPEPQSGLSNEQVEERITSNLVNNTQKSYSKTYRQIFFNNIFTFFNILCIIIATALILVQSYGDLFFMVVFTFNIIIGIYQEIRAKKTIDKLTIVTAPTATVRRNGLTKEIPSEELVLDDIMLLKNGKQISVDAIIVEGSIEVNEALLTGESVPVKKKIGDSLYAGSFVSSGSCIARVDKIGRDCYIQKLQSKAKRYRKPRSELLKSLRAIITVIGIIIIPLGSLIGYRNYKSAVSSALDSTYNNNNLFEVVGLDENDNEIFNASLNDYIRPFNNESSLQSVAVVDTNSFNKEDIIKIKKLKIRYTTKEDEFYSNIAVYNITIKFADGTPDIIANFDSDVPPVNWTFYGIDETYHETNQEIALKMDKEGSYILYDDLNLTSYFTLSIELASRGYVKNSAEYKKVVSFSTVTKTAGSLIGMIPAGMFLLTSMALAVGVLRLSKHKTLVQELYCIEMLARVNVLCLDKTGTITDGTMKVKEIVEIGKLKNPNLQFDNLMSCMLGALEDNNQTSIALINRFGESYDLKKKTVVPFSSARKMSAVTFEDEGTFIMGAPEYIYNGRSKKLLALMAKQAALGYRVLMVAHSDTPIGKDGKIPTNSSALALIVLEDHIRDEAVNTIKWFNENGVNIKVISGDNPITVSEIAKRVDIKGAENYISLEGLSEKDVETIANDYTVFGRVTPDQKALLIKALKKSGNTVAMTGDGVNDILAMKEADCSVAMASGSEAARNVSHLVLMDSNFASMPKVVEEGRRVVNNIQRSSSLFLMKTLFTMMLTLMTIIFPQIFTNGYPFVTKQLMLLESLVIGIPSFFLAIQPNKQQIKGNFLKNIFASCIPSALSLLFSVLIIYFIASQENFFDFKETFDLSNQKEIETMCVLCITFIGLVILYNVCKPLNAYRGVLFGSMFVITCVCIKFLPTYFGLESYPPSLLNYCLCIIIILASIPIVRVSRDLLKKIQIEEEQEENKHLNA